MRSEIHQAPRMWLVLAMAGLAGWAVAQPPTEKPASEPVLRTQLQYTSPIGTYQAYKDQPVQSWREANDRVGQIGGWRAYAKEAQTGKAAEPATNTPSSDPHAGHHGGGKP
ncbi:hypothetical protein [Ottowia sp. VDI28]|uniref:hypothetical protein n=1 Tax=Ottowia sp. VDI28 TaxID=3133968 RepID=UPI003C2D0BEF